MAFMGTVGSSLVLLVSAKTHYHQLSSCASYGMGHRAEVSDYKFLS